VVWIAYENAPAVCDRLQRTKVAPSEFSYEVQQLVSAPACYAAVPAEITRHVAAVIDRYFNFGLVQVKRLRQMRQLGLADEQLLAEQVSYLEWHLGNQIGRRW
jgi:hypothetical protein